MATAKTPAKKTAAKKAPAKAPAAKKEAAPKKALSALEATMYTMEGKEGGTIQLPAEIFGVQWNADLVHQVVVGMQANARPTVAHTKFRGEVRGGGKKPWKQKGTGRARHGSRRSPIWVGGGVTHGPRAEKDYSVKINKKMRAAALMSVLSKKHKDGEVIFVDSLNFTAPKTKDAKAAIVAIATAADKKELVTKRKNAAVIALSSKNATTEKSLRNMSNYVSEEVRNLNPVDLVTKKYLVIENPTEAFKVLTARIAK
ncbi:MAG TPA: 50S ribosomal protein L4 [Candidatus Paceibacterota bacterium]|nr:50S ribosomal protein L4 [Candidatus Paceibacterota bacterium]